ncbi:MAG: D-alanyl-D-alanine carboxypeptidase [Ruminococcaceae bacterium]|nr:D-alanyl-D-alanine carboxypeptidase [Oscillospiraceae bacterium]
MGRKWISLFLCIALLSAFLLPVQAAELELEAPSAILMDAATGTVLYEQNAHERLAPASVTKVMTLLLVMEALDGGKITWNDMVTASDTAAAKGGSQVYLEPGEQMSMDEMLKSVVVSSANDCATALAEHVAGSEAAFVELMNARAQELGMADTHFVNCTGLDDDADAAEHLTSAYDIALMSRALLSHDAIRNYTTIWMDTVRGGQFGLSNTNKLVRFYDGTTGLKTGFTSGAGYCLSASAMREGMELIAVVMHCESSAGRFSSAKALLDYGFANYALVQPEFTPEPVPIRLGEKDSLCPVVEEPAPVLVDKAMRADIRQELELLPEVSAPVAAGQQLGTLKIYAGNEVLSSIPLVAPETVERLSLWALTKRLIDSVCFG